MAIKHILAHPFTFEGKTYNSVDLRRPKGRDMRALARIQDEMEQAMFMIQNLTELSSDEVDEMDVADITSLSKIVEKMMEEDKLKK